MTKKGYTLIELLAVIAIIAIPLITKVIEKAKQGAFEDSMYGIEESAGLAYIKQVTNGNTSSLHFICDGNECKSSETLLDYKGEIYNGNIYVNEKGKVAFQLYTDKYCGIKSYMSDKINIINGKCEVENMLIINQYINFPQIKNGLTIDYDKNNQIFTIDGINTSGTSLLLSIIPFEPLINEVYTVTVIPLNDGNLSGHMNINFELQQDNMNTNVNPRHYVAADLIHSKPLYSRILQITENDALTTKYVRTYFWSNHNNLPSFDNFKFKVMINKGEKVNWVPSINA